MLLLGQNYLCVLKENIFLQLPQKKQNGSRKEKRDCSNCKECFWEALQVVGPIFLYSHCLTGFLSTRFICSNSRRHNYDQFMDEHCISQSYPAMMEQPISKSRKCCWNGSTLERLLSELLYYSGE